MFCRHFAGARSDEPWIPDKMALSMNYGQLAILWPRVERRMLDRIR
jgi:hypothetical protein